MIECYGADAVFYTGTPTYDPATGETTYADEATHTHKVVEENRADFIAGDADCVLYLAAAGLVFAPTVRQAVTYKGRTWTIMDASPTVYRGTVLLYTIGLKGAAA
jgi:hypothetical protein